MSELNNDPRGYKQIIAATALVIVAWSILTLSVNGARLSCESSSGQCVLQRRTLFQTTQDNFLWGAVRNVSVESATTRWTASGGGGRSLTETNIVLHADRPIPVLTRQDALLFGSLSETSLQPLIGQAPPGALWTASFGLTPWFFWFATASVGALFALLPMVRKIEPTMSPDALRSARVHNLSRFVGLGVFFTLFWTASVSCILYIFAFGS